MITTRFGRLATAATVTAALAVGAAACGGGGSDTGGSDVPDSELTAVERGERVARSQGCAGCHGQDFDGGAGPGWYGLAGSEVTLADGSTTVADDDYLLRAILDPSADVIDGYSLKMPANNLSEEQAADIVAFINSLADG